MSHSRSSIRTVQDHNKRQAAISATFWHTWIMLQGFSSFAKDLIALVPDQEAVDRLITAYEPRWEAVEHGFEALSCLAAGDIAEYERLVETGWEGRPVFTLRRLLSGEPAGVASPSGTTDTARAEVRGADHETGELRP